VLGLLAIHEAPFKPPVFVPPGPIGDGLQHQTLLHRSGRQDRRGRLRDEAIAATDNVALGRVVLTTIAVAAALGAEDQTGALTRYQESLRQSCAAERPSRRLLRIGRMDFGSDFNLEGEDGGSGGVPARSDSVPSIPLTQRGKGLSMRALGTFGLEIQRGGDHGPSQVAVVLSGVSPDRDGVLRLTPRCMTLDALDGAINALQDELDVLRADARRAFTVSAGHA
jgi:hypothetical protein